MEDIFKLLQVFAEGGDGGAAAGEAGEAAEAGTTVDTPADDGRARLLALGVPEDKLRAGRNYVPKGAQRQAAAADKQDTQKTSEGKAKLADLLNANPEYKAEVEAMMRQRVAKSAQDSSDMSALKPALAKYLKDNGLPEDTDMATLSRHMMGDYRDKAMELGVSEKTAMEMDVREQRAREQQFREHFDKLAQQAKEFSAIVPGFDLQAELQRDENFRKLTGPAVGMSVEQAYWALHHQDMAGALMQSTQQQTRQMVSDAIRSGSMRPNENGAAAQIPSTNIQKSYRDMTPAERMAFKRSRGLPV